MHNELAKTIREKLSETPTIWVKVCTGRTSEGRECPAGDDAHVHLPGAAIQGHPRCLETGQKVASPEVGGSFFYERDGEVTVEKCPHTVVVPVTTRADYVDCTPDVEKRADNVDADPHEASNDPGELEPACIAAMHYDHPVYQHAELYEDLQTEAPPGVE